MKTVKNCLGLCFVLPMWYFLLYTILSAIHPDRLVWFIFWAYMPIGLIVSILEKVVAEQ